jgi:hypothetical protein
MNQLHIPNGVPLVYNVRAKCINLLEDKDSDEQITVDDFGPAAKYLFQPCELDDAFFDENNSMGHVEAQNETDGPVSDTISATETDRPAATTTAINIEEEIEVLSDDIDSSPPFPPVNGSSVTRLAP